MKPNIALIALMIIAAAFSRLIPHPLNFTPIGGMALFAGAYFKRKELAIIAPLLAMYLSDLVLNNTVYAAYRPSDSFSWGFFPGVYISIAIIAVMGIFSLHKVTIPRLLGSGVAASLLFFLVSNFESWVMFDMYPHNAAGLGMAYIAGLPFLMNTIAGDLTYIAVLFGVYYLVESRYRAQPITTKS